MKQRILLASLLALSLPALQGCLPAVATGVAVGVLAVTDRRSVGAQTDDETIEWKAGNRISEKLGKQAHVNVTAYNRKVLLTGEVPSEAARIEAGEIALKVENVQGIYNELKIHEPTPLSSRSTDAYITSKVKARFVDNGTFSPTHVKVVTEAGVVYLMGLINEREAAAAIKIARTTEGVRTVVNVVELIPEAETKRIDAARANSKDAKK